MRTVGIKALKNKLNEYVRLAVRKGWLRPSLLMRNDPTRAQPVAPLDEILSELERDRADR